NGETQRRIGVAIGDFILDVNEWLPGDSLNGYLALPSSQRRDLRREFSRALEAGAAKRPLHAQVDCTLHLPAVVGDYTDSYASIDHATNVGRMFRPDNPLLPNYRHVPIAYHGRSSSLVPSGTPVRRPSGQTKAPDAPAPQIGPCRPPDYEGEAGRRAGPGNPLGEPTGSAR